MSYGGGVHPAAANLRYPRPADRTTVAVAKRSRRTAGRIDKTRVPRQYRGVGERHLYHLLVSYRTYHNQVRTHLALDKDAPLRRPAQAFGTIASVT